MDKLRDKIASSGALVTNIFRKILFSSILIKLSFEFNVLTLTFVDDLELRIMFHSDIVRASRSSKSRIALQQFLSSSTESIVKNNSKS